jgi:hypothetical protein
MFSPEDRRLDQRFCIRSLCSFELKGRSDHSPIEVQRGAAYSLNVSADGILLLLDREPHIRQLVEIHNSRISRPESATLFEVRWVKALPIGSVRPRYLAGCRLALGRVPFFLFQRRNADEPFSTLQF